MRTNRFVPAITLALLAGSALAEPCPTLTKLGNFFTPGAEDHFGSALSMSFGGLNGAPLLAVGRPNDDPPSGANAGGFAVYQRINGWSLMYDSFNTTGQAGEQLGFSIGLSDPYLIAGAPGFSNTGRARIYRRPSNGSGYTGPVDVVPSLSGAGSGFGRAVAISSATGGWAVVGAPTHTFHGESQAGAAFFFARDAATNTWNQIYQVWGGDFAGAAGDNRGTAVAMSESTPYAAVGSPNHDQGGSPTDHGAVYVFQRLANGFVSGQPEYVTPPSPEANEHFGSAVAIEGDLLVVGAPDEDMTLQEGGFQQAATNGGAIYIFQRTGQFNDWVFVAKLRSPTPTGNARFGVQVDTDGGDRIIVAEESTKRAYLYTKASGSWMYQATLTDPDTSATGSFANGVAVRGSDVAIADEMDDHTATTDAGAVYVTDVDATDAFGDTCATAIPVPSGDFIGCTETATNSAGTPTTCGNGGSGQGPDVFFLFQPTCTGNAIFDTFGSEFDTVLSVHSGCPSVFAGNSIACNDDASFAPPNNRASLVTFNFDAGETYYIRVAGYSGAKGQFTLRHLFTFGVPNETCSSAQTVGLGETAFNNCGANADFSGPTTSCGGSVSHDMWYRFIAPQAGQYRFDLCGNFDPVLTLHNGLAACNQIGPATELGCNDDALANGCNPTSSQVTIQATAGQNILVRVASFGSSSGPGTLTISAVGACGPVDFNGDGNLDPDDLSDYIACYFSQPPCQGADYNSDTNIDPDDLSDYIAAYFAGCP